MQYYIIHRINNCFRRHITLFSRFDLLERQNFVTYLLQHGHFSTHKLINVHFILPNNSEKTVSVEKGKSILEAAHENNIELEGACDGCLACSTCHVILDEQVFNRLPEASEAELDMLDLAPCLTDTSRLGCQIKLDESLEGIKIRLPQITRNFYVDGHVPQAH